MNIITNPFLTLASALHPPNHALAETDPFPREFSYGMIPYILNRVWGLLRPDCLQGEVAGLPATNVGLTRRQGLTARNGE